MNKLLSTASSLRWRLFPVIGLRSFRVQNFGNLRGFKAVCYAVLRGRKPGIYYSSESARQQTDRFSHQYMRKFRSVSEGEEWLLTNIETIVAETKAWIVSKGKVFSLPGKIENKSKIASISSSGDIEVKDRNEHEKKVCCQNFCYSTKFQQ